jgi:alpha-galactosidase
MLLGMVNALLFSAAPTPPMGWNSWDCFGRGVTEEQVLQNADYMAKRLKRHGWKVITIDIEWYIPGAKSWDYEPGAKVAIDAFGRPLPAEDRFPSAKDGKGFKPLADKLHRMGLQLGVHLLRGIPRQAVGLNLPILNSNQRASEIADRGSPCPWNPTMWGVDMAKPGAQEYYDSIFKLLAEWGVDFVKVDDISRPYHKPEIEAIRRAIDRCGRTMVLSLSPGETPLAEGEHVQSHANMWRISDDFWDSWPALLEQFERLHKWEPYRGSGHWPDADMLPLGAVRQGQKDDWTHFTHEEQRTLVSLWCIARSPLILGGHLPKNDEFTLSLLTNDEVLAVNQHSSQNRQIARRGDEVIWVADGPREGKIVGFFNTSEETRTMGIELSGLGFSSGVKVRDIWLRKDIDHVRDVLQAEVPPHGSRLLSLTR